MEIFSTALTDKTQGDGAQTISLGVHDAVMRHQIQVEVSATPSAGTLTLSIKSPGANNYYDLGEVDLVNGPLIAEYKGFVSSMKFTPVGFDADKTYSVYYTAGEIP